MRYETCNRVWNWYNLAFYLGAMPGAKKITFEKNYVSHKSGTVIGMCLLFSSRAVLCAELQLTVPGSRLSYSIMVYNGGHFVTS